MVSLVLSFTTVISECVYLLPCKEMRYFFRYNFMVQFSAIVSFLLVIDKPCEIDKKNS